MKWRNGLIMENIRCSLNYVQWRIISRPGIQVPMNYILTKCYDVHVKCLKQQLANYNLDCLFERLVRSKKWKIRWGVLSF